MIRIGLLDDNVGDGNVASISQVIPSTDVLLVNVRPDRMLDLCAELRRHTRAPLVILTDGDTNEESVVRALEAGANGILTKGVSADELMKAIRAVHKGQIWAPRDLVTRLVKVLASRSADVQEDDHLLLQRLSGREQEILRHTVSGLCNQEIADRLAITQATVKAHLTRVYQKLNVRDRGQLAARFHHTISSAPPKLAASA